MNEINLVERRRQGISTGQALEALGSAMQDPGIPVVIEDHGMQNQNGARMLERLCTRMMSQLNLKDIAIHRNDGESTITITSNHNGVCVTKEGRSFKEVT